LFGHRSQLLQQTTGQNQGGEVGGGRGGGMESKNNEVAIQQGERASSGASSEDNEQNKGYRQSKEMLERNVQECKN